ncbi:MAG: hypothetical protein N2C12_06740 [Planctomycetales bacterium]
MPYLVGTDEAGYGPNLGPLLISASAWHIPTDALGFDLYEHLSSVVTRETKPATDRFAIADSKQLYKSRGSFAGLERAIFPVLASLGHRPRQWNAIWNTLAGDSGAHVQELPWYRDYDEPLPVDTDWTEIETLSDQLQATLSSTDIQLVSLRSVAVFPEQFNDMTDRLGSKGQALTTTTLELLAEVLTDLKDDAIHITCDKHGGRNHYLPALQQQFPDYLVEVRQESRPVSIYCWGPSQRRTEIRFQAKGEQFLPAALASLASKYLRELAMRAFNTFWCGHDPQLQPTAGYPNDAKRVRRDIEHIQRDLGIASKTLWRVK